MHRHPVAVLLALALLPGCSSDESRVREAAARDLACDPDRIAVVRTSVPPATPPGSNDHLYEASGCGQARTYRVREGEVSANVGEWYAPQGP